MSVVSIYRLKHLNFLYNFDIFKKKIYYIINSF